LRWAYELKQTLWVVTKKAQRETTQKGIVKLWGDQFGETEKGGEVINRA